MTGRARFGIMAFAAGVVLGVGVFLLSPQSPLWGDREREDPLKGISPRAAVPAVVPPGSTAPPGRRVEAVAADDSTIELRVVDEAGQPVDTAVAYPSPVDGTVLQRKDLRFHGEADESGSLRLPADGPPDERVLVAARGFLTAFVDRSSLAAARERGPVSITLSRGRGVRGTVRDVWGRPVAGVRVEARGVYGGEFVDALGDLPGARCANDLQSATTDSSGAFEISGIERFPVTMRALAAHFVLFGPPPVVPSGDVDVSLSLHPLCRIGIRLRDATTGDPVEPCRVDLRPQGAGLTLGGYDVGMRPAGVPQDGTQPGGIRWFTMRMGSQGSGPGVRPRVEVRIAAPGYRARSAVVEARWPDDAAFCEPTDIPLESSTARDDWGEVTVQYECSPELRPAELTVFVRDRESADTAALPVFVSLDEAGSGKFSLPRGRYQVKFGAPRGWMPYVPSTTTREIEVAPARPVALQVAAQAGLLELEVCDRGRTPLRDAHITVLGSGEDGMKGMVGMALEEVLLGDNYREYRSRFAPDRGRLRVPLKAGRYSVHVTKPGFGTESIAVDVEANSIVARTVVLAESGGAR